MTTHADTDPIRLFHLNQSSWLQRLATGQMMIPASHPMIRVQGETLAVRPGTSGVIMFPYQADGDGTADYAEILAWMRRSRVRDILAWSVEPSRALDIHMLSHGYHPTTPAYLMARDLNLPFAETRLPVEPVTASAVPSLVSAGIPYVIHEHIPATLALAHQSMESTSVHWLMIREGDKPVAHAIVHIHDAVAGLYNVGVSGKRRRRGIGTALVLGAMGVARNAGAETMVLNSTPMAASLYHRLGFDHIGDGFTWAIKRHGIQQDVDIAEQQLIRAIGAGDTDGISSIPTDIHLRCGLSLQELAARWQQPDMLRAIIAASYIPDIISLWDAGLRDEALSATLDPLARELTTRTPQARPLHHAVARGAGTLVLHLIEAGADLNAEDEEYHATPLDWAHANNKPTIARILRQAGGH